MANGSKHQAGTPQEDSAHKAELHDHERVNALMPWINRGQLEGADRDLVSEELAKSPDFQAKLAQERDLAAGLDAIAGDEAAESAKDADAAWATFKARLPASEFPQAETRMAQDHPPSHQRAPSAARTSAWRRFRLPQTRVGWMATAQTAALAALAFVFVPGQLAPSDDEYRVLSSTDPAASLRTGNVVLILDPASDQATLKELLIAANARIVDGPMANGGYVALIQPSDLDASLETLKNSEAVILAEPLSVGVEP